MHRSRTRWMSALALLVALSLWCAVAWASGKAEKPSQEETYAAALEMLEAGDLYGARDAFKSLAKYEDSAQYLKYTQARLLVLQSDILEARKAFEKLEGFLDSAHYAEQLAEMSLLPMVNVGPNRFLKKANKYLPDASDPASAMLADSYDPDAFRYGLMDVEGVQQTPLEWARLSTTMCLFSPEHAPAVSGSYLCLEHAAGVIGPNHVAAYPIYDGPTEERDYGVPRAPDNVVGWGLMDADGQVLVKPKYGDPLWINDGMVAFGLDGDATQTALFDLTQGAAPHQPVGVWDEVLAPLEGSPQLYAVRSKNAWQYVNRSGQAVTGQTVDRTGKPVENPYDEARAMQHGFGAVRQGNLWGYVNAEGVLALDCAFDEAGDFWLGLAPVREGEVWHYIDETGKRAFPGDYEAAGAFRDGLAPVRQGGRWGYIDTAGAWAVEAAYEEAEPFQPLVHLAAVKSEGRWGVIDGTGAWVAKPAYDAIDPFGPDRVARITQGGEKELYGLIDYKGKVVAKPTYGTLQTFVAHTVYYNIPDKNGNKQGRLDTSGKSVFSYERKISTQYDGSHTFNFVSSTHMGGYSSMAIKVIMRDTEMDGYVVEYYTPQGKRIPLTFRPELQNAETRAGAEDEPEADTEAEQAAAAELGAPVPRPVSVEGLLYTPEDNIAIPCDGVESVPLFPICPEYTIGDLERGNMPALWKNRLQFQRYTTEPYEDGILIHEVATGGTMFQIEDRQSTFKVSLEDPVFAEDGRTIIGFQARSYALDYHGMGEEAFRQGAPDYFFYDDTEYYSPQTAAEFYGHVIALLETGRNTEDIIAVLQAAIDAAPPEDEAAPAREEPWWYRLYDEEQPLDESLCFPVTGAFHIAKEPTGTWRDVGLFPLAYATLGQLAEPTDAEKKQGWYQRVHTPPDCMKVVDGELIDAYAYIGDVSVNLTGPAYDDQGQMVGFSDMWIDLGRINNFTILGYRFDQDPNYADVPEAQALNGQPLYAVNDAVVPRADFYNALWNALLMLPEEERTPLLLAFAQYFPEK